MRKKRWCWWQPVILFLGLVPALVRAQAQRVNPPSTPLLALPAADVSTRIPGEPGGLAILLFIVVTTLVLAAIITANEVRRKREEETVALETRISGALLETPGLVSSSATPTVHIPFWRGAPVRIEMTGKVPTPSLEQSALRVAAQVASRFRPDSSVENRLAVAPPNGARATERFRPSTQMPARKENNTWLAASQHS
ncbi:MAG: hypothetical protein HY712_02160 [candidate division NC10 bacterium]|nr:hypothetical protein [candidate division NC10 bacterium]